MASRSRSRSRNPFRRILGRLNRATENALEIARLGRLTEAVHTPYRVVHHLSVARVRHYGDDRYAPTVEGPLLLIPPLMVTSEIYDVAPDISAVSALLNAGMDVWLVDFGSPEEEEGGLERTLDQHIESINGAVDYVREVTGRDVHVAGYSQGGMFAYQVAAFRHSEGIASVITFGSPVDIRRNLPNVEDRVAMRLYEGALKVLDKPISQLEGLPGFLTSTGFKILSIRKEAQQLVDFLSKLDNRQALEKREARRRFLGGEGFVAWPGPALRKFIDEFIIHNRMSSGGFVIAGQPVTLADITCPVLYFVGERDTIANEAAVRAIAGAVPKAELHEVPLQAGHFGLVVGSGALRNTWPTVVSWVKWQDGKGPRPALLAEAPALEEPEEASFEDVDFNVGLVADAAVRVLSGGWQRLGDAVTGYGERLDSLRYRVPRLTVLQELTADTRISLGHALAEQASRNPRAPFVLWEGRAFSYADADRRVTNVVRGLIHCGVVRGERIAVMMNPRPSYLTMTAALSRLGAVPILLSPTRDPELLRASMTRLSAKHLVTDPNNAALGQELFDGEVLVLGGVGQKRDLPDGVTDMEAIDPDAVQLPDWYEPNPGLAKDDGVIMLTAGRGARPRAARITNRRWAFSAYGTAAACTLSPKDTVYCCLPLHHPAGMLVAVGGGLVGGSRISLATEFKPDVFWGEVRRYGGTVVFYAGEMLRELLQAPPSSGENENPVRLFAGSGLRADVWRRVLERFGRPGVLEFYASTEGNAVLANAAGEKIGALGRPIPGSAEIAVARYDFVDQRFVRNSEGFIEPAAQGETGVLIAHIDPEHPVMALDVTESNEEEGRGRTLRGAFEHGDAWFVTWDAVKQDEDGDYWYVGRTSRMMHTVHGVVPTREVEDALYEFPMVRRVVVSSVESQGHAVPMATVMLNKDASLDAATFSNLTRDVEPRLRPHIVKIVSEIPMTDGFRPKLQAQAGEDALAGAAGLFVLDEASGGYVRATDPGEIAAPRR